MGFSKQILTIPVDQLSSYWKQYENYNIPDVVQTQIEALSETNGRLDLRYRELKDGELCKIINHLSNDQRTALTKLSLDSNELTLLPDSFGTLRALSILHLMENKLTSLPDSFGELISLKLLSLWCNCLTSLPNSLGNLSRLKELFIEFQRSYIITRFIKVFNCFNRV